MVTRLHPYWQEENNVPRESAAHKLEESLKPLLDKAETVLRERPGLAIGMGIALGVVLGWLVKRK